MFPTIGQSLSKCLATDIPETQKGIVAPKKPANESPIGTPAIPEDPRPMSPFHDSPPLPSFPDTVFPLPAFPDSAFHDSPPLPAFPDTVFPLPAFPDSVFPSPPMPPFPDPFQDSRPLPAFPNVQLPGQPTDSQFPDFQLAPFPGQPTFPDTTLPPIPDSSKGRLPGAKLGRYKNKPYVLLPSRGKGSKIPKARSPSIEQSPPPGKNSPEDPKFFFVHN